MMANLVGDSGCNKGQLSNLVEAICRDFRQHDEAELKKLECTEGLSPCALLHSGTLLCNFFRK